MHDPNYPQKIVIFINVENIKRAIHKIKTKHNLLRNGYIDLLSFWFYPFKVLYIVKTLILPL